MTGTDPPPWVVPVCVLGILGVSWYVAAWAVAGWLDPAHDPLRHAISELFALGAPTLPRVLVASSLLASGPALIAFAFALHRGLPGQGRAGPIAAGAAGIMTTAVVAVPCTTGCPGVGASVTDTAHTVVAGLGYLALVLAPLLLVPRIRRDLPVLARWSVVLGGVALVGLLVRSVGVADHLAGLQQRVFNTVADLWYVVAAVALIRRARTAQRRSLPQGRADRYRPG